MCNELKDMENNLENRNNEIKEIEDVKEGIDENIEEKIAISFRQTLDLLNIKKKKERKILEDKIEASTEKIIEKNTEEFKNLKEINEKNIKKIEDLENKIINIEGIMDRNTKEFTELKNTNETLNEVIKNLKQIIDEKMQNLTEKNNLLEIENSKLSKSKNDLESIKNRLEEELKDANNKNQDLKKIETEKKSLEDEIKKIKEYFSSYKKLMEKMQKAQSLKELSNSFESDNEDIKMLKFIQFFGNGEEYLKTIYAEFKDKKMNEKTSLTFEEIEFINFTNKFFKEKEGIEEDVLINVRVNEDKFDKSTMQDILKPSDFSFKIVEEFYVPGVKTKNLNLKAIVKGRK